MEVALRRGRRDLRDGEGGKGNVTRSRRRRQRGLAERARRYPKNSMKAPMISIARGSAVTESRISAALRILNAGACCSELEEQRVCGPGAGDGMLVAFIGTGTTASFPYRFAGKSRFRRGVLVVRKPRSVGFCHHRKGAIPPPGSEKASKRHHVEPACAYNRRRDAALSAVLMPVRGRVDEGDEGGCE